MLNWRVDHTCWPCWTNLSNMLHICQLYWIYCRHMKTRLADHVEDSRPCWKFTNHVGDSLTMSKTHLTNLSNYTHRACWGLLNILKTRQTCWGLLDHVEDSMSIENSLAFTMLKIRTHACSNELRSQTMGLWSPQNSFGYEYPLSPKLHVFWTS